MATISRITLSPTNMQSVIDDLKSLCQSCPALTVSTINSLSFNVRWGSGRIVNFTVNTSNTVLSYTVYKIDGTTAISAAGWVTLNTWSQGAAAELFYDSWRIVLNIARNLTSSFIGFQFVKDFNGSGEVYVSSVNTTANPAGGRHFYNQFYRQDSDTFGSMGGYSAYRRADNSYIFAPVFLSYGTITTTALLHTYYCSQLPSDVTTLAGKEFIADGNRFMFLGNGLVWDLSTT